MLADITTRKLTASPRAYTGDYLSLPGIAPSSRKRRAVAHHQDGEGHADRASRSAPAETFTGITAICTRLLKALGEPAADDRRAGTTLTEGSGTPIASKL